jgi:hypothetical protein
MGKLGCICGNLINDQADNLPYKGYILPDKELDNASNILTDAIDSLAEATKQDKRLDWIKERFTVPPYPINLIDSSMIHDIISRFLVAKKQTLYECENCGRIAIQIGQTNQFKFYKPETDNSKGILGKQS